MVILRGLFVYAYKFMWAWGKLEGGEEGEEAKQEGEVREDEGQSRFNKTT